MLIEISGIDGSGKSTLAAAISGALIGKGVKTYVRSQHSHVRRVAQAISERADRPRDTYIGHDAVEFAVALELAERSRALEVACSGRSVFIVEPYVTCSAAVAATVGISNFDAVMDVYGWAYPADLTIHIETSPETALQRIRSRPASDNLTLRDAIRDLDLYARGFDKALSRLAAGSLLRLDGERPVDEVAGVGVDAVVTRLDMRIRHQLGGGSECEGGEDE